MTLAARIRRWRTRRTIERLMHVHAEWTGRSIALIERTNPTLAGVTWAHARAVMYEDPLPPRLADAVGRLEAVIALVQTALEQESRRLKDSP